ncbi:RIP metalloprotease RseP [Acinetobacter haemolyticus]|uniref:Zinc metalloprotease n=2 Tax=Acinetobacter haemolyticus TaxID=29430 RepID=A0A6B2BQS3_ACIHA|nr:RIP metalloprotease RseP [Acinetobacter haemolyticus]ENW18518.1 RIP metalloprotease RseP [Acinetobacter haemolyticus CIP 64.3 = MTCC 9819]ENW19979.1 RIP metalloprotease RseP [Acinetobacter haemolyticus NIPH 261]EPR90329.1 Membrane-associated zinc metalloprotease [Acinetobacter haemolyticus CIP 64.3 = MTCC 9819]MBO3656787.1 RIP metalloprotease RseP [Acinetobacter haemolyticus]MCU4386471.1 RIP metalloprotease RseP [Acinetobacter haemolyticus]
MNALFMIVAAILLLGPLIAIHEFGHYWVARKLGVKVLVYSIGFGPTLLKWQSKKSGIQYQLSALPLGGYVKMLDEREGNVAEKDLPYAFNRQSPWKRIAIVAAGPLVNLIFAVLLFWILFLPAQEQLNTRIGKIMPDTVAAQVDLQVGDKVVAVDGQSTPTWEKLNFALINRIGESGQVSVVVDRDGSEKQFNLPIQNFLKDQSQSPLDALGFLPYRPMIPAVVKELTTDGAAIRQGMKEGDRIVAINNVAMNDWFDVVNVVQNSPEKLLNIDVMRQGELVHLQMIPRGQRDNMGNVTGVLGVKSDAGKVTIPNEYKQTIQYTPLEALGVAFDKTVQLSQMIFNSIVKMIRGLIGLDNLSGPITIAKVAGQSAEMGWQTFISFMALMSVSLGILNLLPIPMLDGGHLVYYFIEIIRGKPVSEQIQILGLKVGMLLLGSMMLLALFNDFMRL